MNSDHPIRRLIVVDQNATDGVGHCTSYSRMLVSEARARGWECRFLCTNRAKGLAERLGGEPVLPTLIWGDPQLRRFTIAADWVRNTTAAEQSFTQALAEVTSHDLVLLHTAVSMSLFALALWLESLPEERRPRVAAVLHNRERTKEPDDRPIAEALLRRALRAAARWVAAGRLRVFATNQRLIDYLAPDVPHPMGIVPILCDVDPASHLPRTPGSPLTLLHSGAFGRDQGLQFLIDAFTGARAGAFQGIRFLVHTRNGSFSDSVRAQFCSRVEAEFMDGNLDDDAYRQLLGRSDAVLVPYDPESYGFRHSNKVMEALAMGLPSIVTKGTPAADVMIEAGLPGVLADPSALSLAKAMIHLRNHYDQFQIIARAAAPKYRRETTAAFYLQVIEAAFLKHSVDPPPLAPTS